MNPAPTAATTLSPSSPCPCGDGRVFAECCAPVLRQERRAATAEELMRSRFTAHVTRNFLHLHRTCLATSRQPFHAETADEELGDFAWTRLLVHAHETGSRPNQAFVDFSAYYQEHGVELALHEKSEFQRIDGEWFYIRAVRVGPAPVRSAQAKVGRNDPCPCGGGKKYKQCCLARA